MSKTIQERGRPKGLLRSFLRVPIWLYRLKLGWLLGHRFLMLVKLMLGEVGEDTNENCRQLAGAVPLVQLERGGV